MGRRPEEDDREGPESLEGEAARCGRPAHQWRHRARRSAQHDVLRRAWLEPERVDEDVAEQPGGGERRGQAVDRDPELDHRDDPERRSKEEPAPRLDPAAGQGSPLGSGHARIGLALDVVVDRPGSAGGQVAAEASPEDGGERRASRVGDEHRRHAGEQEQGDDPRLGQRDVVVRHPDRGAHGAQSRVAGSDRDRLAAGPPRSRDRIGTGAEMHAHAAAADASARGARSRAGDSLGSQASR